MSNRSTHVTLRMLEQRFSPERLRPYRTSCSGGLRQALALYVWNAKVSAAFWLVLGHTEVVVRNAIHDELTAWVTSRQTPSPWYDQLAHVLSAEAVEHITDARRRLARDHKRETPGRVVAELSFGFWRFLLSVRYQRTLWTPRLHAAFPHSQGSRRTVHDALHRLHNLRNRIAHQEPIHHRDLAALHDDLLSVVGWICPTTRDWIARDSGVPSLLSRRPG